MNKRYFRLLAVAASVVAVTFALAGNVLATAPDKHVAGEDSLQLMQSLDDAIASRMAPNTAIQPGAYLAAAQAAAAMPSSKGSWTEIGPYNYFTDDPTYADPNFSNSGSGDRYVSGRITGLAATADGQTVVAGGADGGLWRSTDAGAHWTPVGDKLFTLSIGAVAVDQSTGGCVFLAGTGEANTNFDAYAGVGIYRSADCGQTWSLIGPSTLRNKLVWRIRTDPNVAGQEWAATSDGIYRSGDTGQSWRLAYQVTTPTPDFVANQWTDIAVQPGTSTIVAANGWRNGGPYNGLYISRDGGASFTLDSNPNGWVPTAQAGRVTLEYSADGSQLYGIDEDPTALVDASKGVYTALGGVFSAKNGDPAGPWNQIANATKLMNSGSAERVSAGMKGYQPGVQAWYNQSMAVDPANPQHLYIGLEEVYESLDGGSNWNAVAPYWNLTLPCFSYQPFEGSCDPNGAHSDQHAAYIANGTLWIGNDGGVWSRSLANHNTGQWTDLNQTLGTLQFYGASAGKAKGGALTYYGGMQDNGTAKVIPGQLAVQPFGGDGGFTYVDPSNPDNVMTEYVYLSMAKSTNGGHSWTSIAPPDPNARFIAPFGPDEANPYSLVAGGEYVWTSSKGFATTAADWTAAFDTGAGHSITAIDSANGTVYAGWCGPCNSSMNQPDAARNGFGRGLVTNYGGSFHQVALPANFPRRFISGVYADESNPAHAYVTLSGFSRNWVEGPNDPGVGHVYETNNGGESWTDISSNLVDAPALSILAAGGHLVVGTDVGVFESSDLHGTSWKKVGSNLPNVSVWQLSVTPAGTILAASHGRGLWTFPVGKL